MAKRPLFLKYVAKHPSFQSRVLCIFCHLNFFENLSGTQHCKYQVLLKNTQNSILRISNFMRNSILLKSSFKTGHFAKYFEKTLQIKGI